LRPGFMDAWQYHSQELYDLEMRRLFPRSWVFVGDALDLPEPGDYLTETVGYEPVVVVRGNDGELRAFSNVCPHRAALVADGAGNCGGRFTCPYHGWTFHLDGGLAGIPLRHDFVEPPDAGELSMRPVRLESWDRFLFVNVSGDAKPLADYLGEIPGLLTHHRMSGLTRGTQLDDVTGANWKVVMDNAFCDYHVTEVHGSSIGRFGTLRDGVEREHGTGGVLALPWQPSRLTDVAPGLAGEGAQGSIGAAVFPNFHLIGFPTGGVTVMWWTPVDLTHTRARVWSYSADPAADPRADADLLRQVQEEDYAICAKVQAGLRSELYRPGPRHYYELRVGAFQRWMGDMLAGDHPAAGLRAEG
jgi:nitrite reductase/ring-hydroxylating ferredoxin subunit